MGVGVEASARLERCAVFVQPGRVCERTGTRRHPSELRLSFLSPCSSGWEPPRAASGSALDAPPPARLQELFVERWLVAGCEALPLSSCQSPLLSWDFFAAQIHPNRIRVLIFLYYCFNGMQTGSRS